MTFKVSLEFNPKDFNMLDGLKKEFRKDVIEDGLDEPIQQSIKDLKTELRTLVNEQISLEPVDPTKPLEDNNLGQQKINVPKSEAELLNYLTNTDVKKYNTAKDFTELSEANILFAQPSRSQDSPNRVTLKMEIAPGEDFDSHLIRAREFFKTAVIAIPGVNGKTDYYFPTGDDIINEVKIVCSTQIGEGQGVPHHGKSPKDRFDTSSKQGYASWTIKQSVVDRIRNNNSKYVNITDVINRIKSGDHEGARNLANSVNSSKKLEPVIEKIDNLEKKEDLTPSVENYSNIIGLINQISVVKQITKKIVTYRLVSNFTTLDGETEDVLARLKKRMSLWIITNSDGWFKKLVKKAELIIRKFSR